MLYWVLSRSGLKIQNLLILAASYFFYGYWDWRFLALILFSTIVDYYAGIGIENAKSVKLKKRFLFLSIGVNIGLLAFFKYFNFFIDSFIEAFNIAGGSFDPWSLKIILPVGISFYTFQTLSYSIDIYKGKLKPTKDFIGFAAFVSFFPQLVAGPIERASNLLPQFFKERKFDYQNASNGLTLMIYGFFKKVVIADRLAPYVNNVFDNYTEYNTPTLIIAAVFFSIQIYCDFSGYSLIARGISKMFGFDLMVNFNRPYLAANFSEFWKRWHISLSSWFRDYVYIPLGGNRVSTTRVYLNLMIVFLVSGLWHGANWTFVIWGGLHGLYLILNQLKANLKWSTPKIFNIVVVYVMVVLAWIFFRADSIQDAWSYLSRLGAFNFSVSTVALCAEMGIINLVISFGVIILLALSYFLPSNLNMKTLTKYVSLNTALLLLIYLLGTNEKTEFIYFQF